MYMSYKMNFMFLFIIIEIKFFNSHFIIKNNNAGDVEI